MMRAIALFLIMVLIFAVPAPGHALGPSTGQHEHKELIQGKEKSKAVEKHREKRKTEGTRRERRVEQAALREAAKLARKALTLRTNRDFLVEVSLSDLLLPAAASLEKEGLGVFGKCRLITRPPTLKDMGIDFEPAPGLVDVIKKDYYQSLASSGDFAPLKQHQMDRVVYCSLEYAKVLGSAGLRLSRFLRQMQGWLGYADARKLARKAIAEAIKHPDSGVSELVENAKDAYSFPCRFRSSIDTFLCGALLVKIRPHVAVCLASSELFGQKFAGIGGSFRLNSAWSLDRSWDKVVRESSSSRTIQAKASYVEQLEAQGKVWRAAMIKRKVLNLLARDQTDLLLSPMP